LVLNDKAKDLFFFMLKDLKTFFTLLILLAATLYGYLTFKTLYPKLPSFQAPIVFYSNQTRQDLKTVILNAIHEAKHSLFVVMFGLSDMSILEALEESAKRGVKVKLFYDQRSSPFIEKKPRFQIEVRKKGGLMHQKIVIVDEKMVFLGSANLTASSLSMHGNLLVGFYSPSMAQFLIKKAPDAGGACFRGMIGTQNINLFLLPDRKKEAIASLLRLLRLAKKNIHMAMFTLTYPVLVKELINAKKRGLDVTVIVDARSGMGIGSKTIAALKRAKVNVMLSSGIELLHYKHLIIDDNILVSGSTNWTKAAFLKNRDCFFILRNLNPSQREYLKKLESILEKETL
jgi:phosphatidylserine/phosphatidylglycerophosphate/cardiolipin synthase-like enzyme